MSAQKKQSWTEKTISEAQTTLRGENKGLSRLLPFIGPAIIASIAYEDPGNFATNIQGGAEFGYMLLWVIVIANLMAMLFQALSAKLGIVTDKSLATQCKEHFPPWATYAMWIGSEIAAMATDLAEFLGASVGVSLLFGLPIIVSFILVGIVTYGILLLQGYGFRPMEIVIASFVSIISLSYLAELIITKQNWISFAYHSVVPHLAGANSITLAVGIIGATVMPHAIYLHSSLTQNRIPTKNNKERKSVLRFSNMEVLIALGVAGLVNMAMLAMAASVFYMTGHQGVADIQTAYQTLIPLMGIAAAGIFLLSLLASGISSSVVGTMAGQTIMQDFVGFKIPLWVRRLATMIPTLIVIALGVDATRALVISQVVLSIVLPIPIVALIIITSRRDIMGEFVNSFALNTAAIAGGCVVLTLNAILLFQIAGISIPSLGR
jgi:manganese transport protein